MTPEFRRSVVLRWQGGPDITGSLGYIDNEGRGWFGDAWNTAVKLGRQDTGDRYLDGIARQVSGSVRRYEKGAPRVLGPDGKSVDIEGLLSQAATWRSTIAGMALGLDSSR